MHGKEYPILDGRLACISMEMGIRHGCSSPLAVTHNGSRSGLAAIAIGKKIYCLFITFQGMAWPEFRSRLACDLKAVKPQ